MDDNKQQTGIYRCVDKLTEDELNELRQNLYYHGMTAEEAASYTDYSEIPESVVKEHYADVSFLKEDFFCNNPPDEDWILSPQCAQARNLPDGWQWVDYGDGSGHLQNPNGNSFFSYDRQPYSFSGGIEYRVSSDHHYTAFWGTIDDFKNYAESYMKNQYIPPLDKQEADRSEPEVEASADNDYEPEM